MKQGELVWIEIREPATKKLLLRYDPERDIIEVQRRGRITLVDLRKYKTRAEEDSAKE